MADADQNAVSFFDDLSGKELGDYQVIRRLGQGGMATVYLAQQQSLKRKVALKILKPELAKDTNYVRRFQNEAQSAAALVHANIVQIHEVGQIDDLQFIAQEYVAGQNLKQLLDREVSLSAEQATAILRQVAAALRKAGKHGIVHRDIKPENILLNTDGVVKVADFGLARQDQSDGLDLTQVGVTMGTPLYMSPEQVEGRKLDSRSDIYSLGVTAYQMLAGQPPFDGDTPLAVALKHAKETPQPLAPIRPDVPAQLCAIVHQMLAKSPANRFDDANQLARQLDALPVAGRRSDTDTSPLIGAVLETLTAEPSLEETRELATVLLSRENRFSKRKLIRILPYFAMGLLGILAAWTLRSPDPLRAGTTSDLEIERMETARAQLMVANLANTEQAFLAVEKYFPLSEDSTETDVHYNLLAKEKLAYFYLENARPSEALPILEQLTLLDESHNSIRIRAFARLVLAYQKLDQSAKAVQVLEDLSEFLQTPVLDEYETLRKELEGKGT